MKTKMIFSTKTKHTECWTDLPFVPRKKDWFNIQEILMPEEISAIKKTASKWSGKKGIVQSIEYRHDDNDFYVEIIIGCE
jgi:hypothetical protein